MHIPLLNITFPHGTIIKANNIKNRKERIIINLANKKAYYFKVLRTTIQN